jgi:hypothetical protein
MRSRARVYRTGFGGYQFAILKEPGALAVIAAREFLGYGLDKREVRWRRRRESRRVLRRQF